MASHHRLCPRRIGATTPMPCYCTELARIALDARDRERELIWDRLTIDRQPGGDAVRLAVFPDE